MGYIHPTQHTTLNTGRFGVVSIRVYDPYKRTVYNDTQYNGTYMCVYMLLPSPEYSQIIPRTSFPWKCLSRVLDSPGLTFLVISRDTFPCPVS